MQKELFRLDIICAGSGSNKSVDSTTVGLVDYLLVAILLSLSAPFLTIRLLLLTPFSPFHAVNGD